MLMEIFSYIFQDNSDFIIHVMNLFILVTLIILFIFVRRAGKKWTRVNDYFGIVTKTINSVRYGDLTKKIEKLDLPESGQLSESLNRMIETLHDREAMIVEAQNNLHMQNKFLEAIINSLSDGLVIVDDKYKILRATPRITEWFEESGNKLIEKNLVDYIEIANGKKIEELKEDEIVLKSDVSSNFIASAMELKLEDKKHRHVVIIKNITDQKELETLKEDFVATLTHDLKVPIIAETNMLELFLNENFGPVSEKQEVALKNMQASNKELLELVQTVLDTYKMRDGKIRLYKENIMLKSFLGEIVDEMRPIALKTGNPLQIELPRDIMVYADRMQLKRVVKNLISNAISYGEHNSPIEIRIGEVPGFIVIHVKDYGAGISKADLNKIFNKYYSASKKFRKIGTGLGLYFSKQIIKAHGGDLTVESEVGEFTEFTVKLPAVMNISLHYGE